MSIEQKAIKTYQKNLEFFKINYPKVHKKLELLETVIGLGEYKEKYSLEYKEEGYFDIQEIATGSYLYKTNSIMQAKEMENTMDLKRQGAVFKAQQHVFATDAQAEAIDKSELSFHNGLWSTIKIINYTSQFTSPDTYMQRVQKIIFLGIGLGLHLEGIIKKLNPIVIFIKEKNLETFRLSLFVTDYSKVLHEKFIHFSLTDDEEEERENFIEFLNQGNNFNLNLKHIPFTSDYTQELQRLQQYVLSQNYISYGYSAVLLRYVDSPYYLANGEYFLNVSKLHHDLEKNIFSQKPILLAFSGPSTQKNKDWLIENRERFILVSPLSACRYLKSINIFPDIIMHIDPNKETATALFTDLDPKNDYKNTTCIFSSNVSQNIKERFTNSKIYFVEQGTSYKQGYGKLSAPSVGEYSYALFTILGASQLFTLGIDLAVDPDTMKSHGEFHPTNITAIEDKNTGSLDPHSNTIFVKGNFIDLVPSLATFKLSLIQFEIFSDMLKNSQCHAYNLSNGAYLKGITPLKIEEFDWTKFDKLNKEDMYTKINESLQSMGSNEFTEEEKNYLKEQIKEAKKLEKIIKEQKKKKFTNINSFLDSLGELSWNLSDMQNKSNSDLAEVYYEYFQIVLSYIYDLFNTKKLQKPHSHMQQVNIILTTQLLKMSDYYIKGLGVYLK
jgi:hypothetical protein